MTATKYTVVQHSGFGYNNDPMFEKGLEPHAIPNRRGEQSVRLRRGLVFDSYAEADAYCDQEMHPEGTEGLIAQAPGTFSDLHIDSLRLYVPKS